MRISQRLLKKTLWASAFAVIAAGCNQPSGPTFPDLSTAPTQPISELEVFAEIPEPPGNISVGSDGRVFITIMPESNPDTAVAELIDGEIVPFPDASWQPSGVREDRFVSVLPVRVDLFNRLWLVDAGFHGIKERVRIMAFDLDSRELVHQTELPLNIMGIGSYANDFQISEDGKWLYLSDSSIVGSTTGTTKPGIVVYDIENQQARRVLHDHHSVRRSSHVPVAQGVVMSLVNPNVDGIALSRDGSTLYYGGFSNLNLYRINTDVLTDFNSSELEIDAAVELVGAKTMSDGMTIDAADNLYLTDVEHDAVIKMDTDTGELTTVFKDPSLRWPDGYSFGPDGYLYLTCSALHQVFGKSKAFISAQAPFQIYRWQPGDAATPGH